MSIIELNGRIITEDTVQFSAGEVQLKIPENMRMARGFNTIKAHITSTDGIMLLAQLASVLEGEHNTLVMPYLPYSRYDHRELEYDPLSLKVFAGMINSMGFNRVVVHDCHSDVGIALLDRCVNIPQHILALHHFNLLECHLEFQQVHDGLRSYEAIVAPDSGASKKAFKLAEWLQIPLIVCDKHREHKTGKIINFSVPEKQLTENKFGHILMVDDIADGGGTFIGLSNELTKYVDSVDLYVTHGIFSKGKDHLLESIDNIFCYHDWSDINFNNFEKHIDSDLI